MHRLLSCIVWSDFSVFRVISLKIVSFCLVTERTRKGYRQSKDHCHSDQIWTVLKGIITQTNVGTVSKSQHHSDQRWDCFKRPSSFRPTLELFKKAIVIQTNIGTVSKNQHQSDQCLMELFKRTIVI